MDAFIPNNAITGCIATQKGKYLIISLREPFIATKKSPFCLASALIFVRFIASIRTVLTANDNMKGIKNAKLENITANGKNKANITVNMEFT